MITLQQFATAVGCTVLRAEQWYEPFKKAIEKYAVKNTAMLLAQVGHESANLSQFTENLNYSAQRLCEVWPSRFPSVRAAAVYANNPERLANMVYASRMGNGDTLSGDGWRYRGRGPIQITGRENYQKASEATGKPLVGQPDLALDPSIAAEVATWFFVKSGADTSNIDHSSDAINLGRFTSIWGDANGFADRKLRYERALKVCK